MYTGSEVVGGDQGGALADEGELSVLATIVSANTGSSQCAFEGVASGSYDLVYPEASGCSFATSKGSKLGEDPMLGALAANGGPTHMQAITSASPAAGVIPDADCKGLPATDQRGVPRPGTHGGPCSIGAFEVEPEPPT